MENQEQFQYNDGRVIVPYDKDRKRVTFYDTYVDINGDVVRYDDIAIFQSEALDYDSQIVLYFSKSFTYKFAFTTYDGTVHVLKRNGYSAYWQETSFPPGWASRAPAPSSSPCAPWSPGWKGRTTCSIWSS